LQPSTVELVCIILFVLAGIFSIVTVFIFFKYNIKDVYYFLTGKKERETISKIKNEVCDNQNNIANEIYGKEHNYKTDDNDKNNNNTGSNNTDNNYRVNNNNTGSNNTDNNYRVNNNNTDNNNYRVNNNNTDNNCRVENNNIDKSDYTGLIDNSDRNDMTDIINNNSNQNNIEEKQPLPKEQIDKTENLDEIIDKTEDLDDEDSQTYFEVEKSVDVVHTDVII